MAFTLNWYGAGALGLVSGTSARRVDWVTDTIKVALTTSAYSPDQDAHDFFNDVTNEISGTGYTSGGAVVGSKALTYDNASNTVRLDAADAQWTSATFTARRCVVYKDTGVTSTSPLLGYGDFGADTSVTAGTFSIEWDATDGVLKMVVS